MSSSVEIVVGARASALSRAQVEEVRQQLCAFHPQVGFSTVWVETQGDIDLKTPLRTLDKTDFFTREIDLLQLSGGCRVSIHSAKDLPDPLPEGLVIVALTKCLDPTDVLVADHLPLNARIGTSSERREQNVKALRGDLVCQEIRGSILSRLEQLDSGLFDGVVIAEAALLRLGLSHRKRIPLPGAAAPLQGQLAVLALKGDVEMDRLFECIDVRRRVLYLGTDPSAFQTNGRIVHYPVIKIVPRTLCEGWEACTHIIFTSKNAVSVLEKQIPLEAICKKTLIAVGSVTAAHLQKRGIAPHHVAQEEHQEGIISLLRNMDLEGAYFFLPRSSLSRPVLVDYLKDRGIAYLTCDLYDTQFQAPAPLPDFDAIDEILFTSPSTVKGFLKIHKALPEGKKLRAIGPITENALLSAMFSLPMASDR